MAGVMLIIVYGATSYIGAVCSVDFPGAQNGAEILTWAVKACYGIYGQLIIGAIFFIACFNVCVGLSLVAVPLSSMSCFRRFLMWHG